MKNKKGFSLVELLIVIAIVGVLAGIIVPSVVRYLKGGKEEYNTKLSTELVAVAKSYYAENKGKLPRGNLDNNGLRITKALISASYLVNNNYMTGEFKDSEGNDCTNASYVIVEKEGNDYKYTSCIICNNTGYKNNDSANDKCNYKAPSTDGTIKDNIPPRCELTYKSGTVNNWTNQNVYLTLTAEDNDALAYYYLNQDADGTGKLFEDNPGQKTVEIKDNIETDSYYAIVEDASTGKIQCTFDGSIKIDKVKPKIKGFKIISNNINYNAKYTTIEVNASDEGSGVDKVCVTTSNDSSTCSWNNMESEIYTDDDYHVTSSDGSGKTDTLYAFVKDKAGNISDSFEATYQLYKYCTYTTISSYGSWSSCSKDCGGGTKTRDEYRNDKYFIDYTCESTTSKPESCNTNSCGSLCYRVTAQKGLNCRYGKGTNYDINYNAPLFAYSYYMFEYDSSGWYRSTDYGCYATSDYLEYYGTSCPSSGGSTGGGTTGGGATGGSCTCPDNYLSLGSVCHMKCATEAICKKKCDGRYGMSGSSGYCIEVTKSCS